MPRVIPVSGRTPDMVEMDRILELDVVDLPDAEDTEIASFERLSAEAFALGDRLFPEQVAAIEAYERVGGGLFPMSVGSGKTGVCLQISQIAAANGHQRILWMCPVTLVESLLERHIPEWRRRIAIHTPFHVFAGKSPVVRMRMASFGTPGVYVFPYSLLSTSDTMDVLQLINPSLIIADEAHLLRNPRSARTRRFMAFFEQQRPQLVCLSGTITSKRISDYWHLAQACLHAASPLPQQQQMANRWGSVIDADAQEDPTGASAALLSPLIHWAARHYPEDIEDQESVATARKAYQKRLRTSPGVVITDKRPPCSLRIINEDTKRDFGQELQDLINRVNQGRTPIDEPIPHAIHAYKWHHELNSGIYNSLRWPSIEELCKNRNIDESEARTQLLRAQDHHACLLEYYSALRQFFDDAPPGMDTMREVGREIALNGYDSDLIPPEIVELWENVKACVFPLMPKRIKEPVRVDPFRLNAVVEWCKSPERKKGALLMYTHIEVGKWLNELLVEAGLDVLYAPAGTGELVEAEGDPERGGKGERFVVASTRAHGTGRNLQAFDETLYVEWPRSPILAEQALGRTHRTGQKADEVRAYTMLWTEFDDLQYAATLNDSLYISQSIGSRQRVIYADYQTLPKTFPYEVLRERGFKPEELTVEGRRELEHTFGRSRV